MRKMRWLSTFVGCSTPDEVRRAAPSSRGRCACEGGGAHAPRSCTAGRGTGSYFYGRTFSCAQGGDGQLNPHDDVTELDLSDNAPVRRIRTDRVLSHIAVSGRAQAHDMLARQDYAR